MPAPKKSGPNDPVPTGSFVWVRVQDHLTGHQYDIMKGRLDSDGQPPIGMDLLPDRGEWVGPEPRPAKHRVDLAGNPAKPSQPVKVDEYAPQDESGQPVAAPTGPDSEETESGLSDPYSGPDSTPIQEG